ncbi:hypothetical protein Sjap_016851 [Stephania japonica]|uniref:Methyltransferase-like protein 2 n=1 Tax=Stephania japonica TaxID=461633 RepID=A0AAP0NLB0_9MAGN
MAVKTDSTVDELSNFTNSGVHRLDKSLNTIFVDPVRLLDRSYARFKLSPSMYYTRFFAEARVCSNPRKRKRKRKLHCLNEREQSADRRHQGVRDLLLRAHEGLLCDEDLLSGLRGLNKIGSCLMERKIEYDADIAVQDFVELGRVWQAPLYEIALRCSRVSKDRSEEDTGSASMRYDEQEKVEKVVPLFNNLVVNDTSIDVEAEFLNTLYVMPRNSCFYMSDLEQIHNLVPAEKEHGYNLIVIDPPWENGSARQKSAYPTLPNRYLLSIPIKQLTHTEGALVALWVTNREKLRVFVEKELFPSWGVDFATLLYWLKVKPDGSLVSELDLFHHRPYECLILGYCHGEAERFFIPKPLEENQVVVSIPGDYSRKPPIGKLLLEYAPGPKPACCLELFARELMAGWTSWGNEPLHFQDSSYFVSKKQE